MKITLITACRNAAATINDTLRSVAEQTHREIDYIVLDGASSDGTAEQVRAFMAAQPQLQMRFVSAPDRNVYEAWNKALAMARGEVIGFLNADDFFADAQVLSHIAAAFSAADVDCVYGDLDFVSPADTGRVVRRWRSQSYETGAVRRGWHPPHPTLYVRREVYARLGGFDPQFPLAADVQFMVRLFESPNVRAIHLPKVLVHMRAGGISNGSVRKHMLANWQCFVAIRNAGVPINPLYMLRKPLSRLGQFLRRDWRRAAVPPC